MTDEAKQLPADLVPPMTFRVEDLMRPERFRDGPMVVFWNQAEFFPPETPPSPPVRRRGLYARATRRRLWNVFIRLQPPEGDDLAEFGEAISQRVGMTIPPSDDPDHRAICLVANGYYKNAPEAIGAAGRLLGTEFTGVTVRAAQIVVERAGA